MAHSDQQSFWGQLAAGFRALAEADVNKGQGRTKAAIEGLERAAVAFHPLLSLSTSMSRDMTKEFHWQAFLGHVRAASTILQIRPNYILDQMEPAVITPLDSIYLPNDLENVAAPGAVDIYAVAAGAPHEVLKRLIRERAGAVARQCAAMSFREIVDRLREIEPINPILIASIIATSIVKGEDVRSLLRKYVAGEQIGPLENDWLALDFLPEEERSRVLAAERLFVDAFTLLSLESILVSRYGHLYFPCKGQAMNLSVLEAAFRQFDIPCRPEIPYDMLQYFNTATFPDDWTFNAFDIHLHSWSLASPLCLALGPEGACHSIVRHGFDTNSAIHNARQRQEYELNESYADQNKILALKCTPHEKKLKLAAHKLRQQNLDALLERSRRLYFWNPMEAHAKANVGRFEKIRFLKERKNVNRDKV